MKRLAAKAFGLAVFPLLVSVGMSMDLRQSLPEDVVQYLPEEARTQYLEAVQAADQLAYRGAMRHLAAAAEAAPQIKELQFLLVEHARDRAEIYYGADSFYADVPDWLEYSSPTWHTAQPYIEMAEHGLQRLSNIGDLTGEERRRVEAEITAVEELREGLPERDRQRFEDGIELVEEINFDRRQWAGLSDSFDLMDIRNAFDRAPRRDLLEEEEDPDAPPNPFATQPGEYRPPFLPRYVRTEPEPGAQPGMGYDPYAGFDPTMMQGGGMGGYFGEEPLF